MTEAERLRRLAALRASHAIQMSEFSNAQERGLDDVNDEFGSRGMFRSGGRLEERADLIQQINEQRARSEFNLAEGSSEANRQAQNVLAELAQSRAEQEISARARIADREFQMASQARAEALAKQQRDDWLAEQARLQALYNSSGGGSGGGGGGGGGSLIYSPPARRTPTSTMVLTPGPVTPKYTPRLVARPPKPAPEHRTGTTRYF